MPETNFDFDLSVPQRQSVLGVVVYLLRYFRAFISLGILLFAMTAASPVFMLILLTTLLPVLIFIGVLAYYQYKNFTFHVAHDELIIHKGVFFKQRTVLSIDRIQSIQITENLVQRILKLVAIKVDTAGARASQLEIPALKEVHAKALRELIYAKKKELLDQTQAGEAVANGYSEGEPVYNEEQDAAEIPLVSLGLKDLLIVGITENHIRTGFIALAFLFGTINQYQAIIEKYFDENFDDIAVQMVSQSITIVLITLVLFAFFSILLSVIRTTLRFYGLKAVLKRKSVDISTGLIKREKYSVPNHKIQFVRFESNPLRRVVGFESAKIRPSSSVQEPGANQRIEIPALKKTAVETLTAGIFENYKKPGYYLEGDKWGYARLWFNVSFAILAGLAVGFYFEVGLPALLILCGSLPIGLLGYFYGKTIRVFYDNEHVVIQKGWVFINRTVFPTYKIQGIKYRQPIFLKSRKLCHLSFFTAAGLNSVRYLQAGQATRLYNLMLYWVESTDKSWM